MFVTKNEPNELGERNDKTINALLGKGSEFDGKLVFEGTVRIDGTFKGEIISKDKLLIGDSAIVEAEINVDTVVISGNVTGNIHAKSRVELKAPGKVRSNIETPVLLIEEGVLFDGNCKMSENPKESTQDLNRMAEKKDKKPFNIQTFKTKEDELEKR